jgi:hypothetical protein
MRNIPTRHDPVGGLGQLKFARGAAAVSPTDAVGVHGLVLDLKLSYAAVVDVAAVAVRGSSGRCGLELVRNSSFRAFIKTVSTVLTVQVTTALGMRFADPIRSGCGGLKLKLFRRALRQRHADGVDVHIRDVVLKEPVAAVSSRRTSTIRRTGRLGSLEITGFAVG